MSEPISMPACSKEVSQSFNTKVETSIQGRTAIATENTPDGQAQLDKLNGMLSDLPHCGGNPNLQILHSPSSVEFIPHPGLPLPSKSSVTR